MSELITVRDLRRRWKPHKERLENSATSIRFHRACSWLQRVEQIGEDHDFVLLGQWVAFNSLYGQWNEKRQEPLSDQECWKRFLDRIMKLDKESLVPQILTEHKRLVLSLLEDQYLSRFYWQDPNDGRARKAQRTKHEAQTWYVEKRWVMILDRLIERIYLLRCQLVHGAATYGGSLNRTALKRCCIMLGHLLPAVLQVWIDHGSDEDWGAMCYPPLR